MRNWIEKWNLTGKRESKDSPCWARSLRRWVLSLNSESDNADISASKLLMRVTVPAYCCLVDSPASVPLKIPPRRPPREAMGDRRRPRREDSCRGKREGMVGSLREEVGRENPNNLVERGKTEGRLLSTGGSSRSAAMFTVLCNSIQWIRETLRMVWWREMKQKWSRG